MLLVEDDPVWLQSLTEYIHREDDMLVVATTTNKKDALAFAATVDVDLYLIDINLTGNQLDGIDTALEIREIDPDAKMIMLTNIEDIDVIKTAIAGGVDNYITKNHYHDIPQAVRDAVQDRSAIHSSVAKQIREDIRRAKQEEYQSLLTNAEKDVLSLVAQGKTRKQIEDILFITESTIKKHLNKIFKKLNVRRSEEAVAVAIKKGVIEKRGD
jgi:two-component system, NarL family, response regulator DevR